jgi:flavin reductase (DIM6/NTAB) family NADH-FMN oxidoreductase RutF
MVEHATTAAEFTSALAEFASGVAVVAVRDDDDDVGITTTAFASVSLDPPLVLVAINSASYVDEVLAARERWAVSVLARDQEHVASRFAVAGRPSARHLLTDLGHHRGELSGALIVDDGLTALECQTHDRVPAGDHTVLIGRVLQVDYRNPDRPPLIHFRSRYRGLAGTGRAG